MSTYRLWRAAGIVALLAMAGLAGRSPAADLRGGPSAHRRRGPGLGSHHPARRPRLAAGQRTAVLGKAVYAERCAACHGETGEDPKYSRLVAARARWPQTSL